MHGSMNVKLSLLGSLCLITLKASVQCPWHCIQRVTE